MSGKHALLGDKIGGRPETEEKCVRGLCQRWKTELASVVHSFYISFFSEREVDKRMSEIGMSGNACVIEFRGFNQKWLEKACRCPTLRSDGLCDHHGHPDLAADSARCLDTLRKQRKRQKTNRDYVLYCTFSKN